MVKCSSMCCRWFLAGLCWIFVPAYLSLLGISWTVFHSMFVKVLLPENNPPPVLGLLIHIALSSFSASFFSLAENGVQCRNSMNIIIAQTYLLWLWHVIESLTFFVCLNEISGQAECFYSWRVFFYVFFPKTYECTKWLVRGVEVLILSKQLTKREHNHYFFLGVMVLYVWWL